MKPTNKQYFNVKLLGAETRAEFNAIEDFTRFVEFNQLKSIFLVSENGAEANQFGVLHKGGILLQPNYGYKTLEDFAASVAGGFPDAATFYAAAVMGYEIFSDYTLALENGITSKKETDELKSKGYADGWNDIKQWLSEGNRFNTELPITNALELYRYGEASNYADYKTLKASVDSGFKDSSVYFAATEKGFASASDYSLALKMGFTNNTDLSFAREHKIRDRSDFDRYLMLQYLTKTGCKHDERVLLVLLSKIEQGKKVPLNKLYEVLTKEIETYKYSDNDEIPEWFTITFHSIKDIAEFLKVNENVKEYGHYHSDGSYFQVNKLQDRKVVIDGSNVAHNSHGNEKSKPAYANIILLVNELKTKGFTHIKVINDASLKHKISDADKLSELKKLADVSESPAETAADIFLINHVKSNHCLLVSNDTFLEWRGSDSWVLDNIDFYRIAFKITGDHGSLPDLG